MAISENSSNKRFTQGTALGRTLPQLAVLLVIFTAPLAAQAAKLKIDFNRDIRPILSNKCFRCHGPDSSTREAELRLDREEDAKADRDGHPVVVPGEPDASELIRRIFSEDDAERMPPKDSNIELSAKEVAKLKRWVAEGAVWSLPWTYVPPKRHALPKVEAKDWAQNWIDLFILARLEDEGLKPSSDADKTTLIRRLSVDFTGLPPTPAEVETFLKDESPQAYERLVDRLLASPRFGERMAVYWLDLVRYADTVGYHGDQDHYISPYRDYVINAFNADMPFDRFTREQLAGDQLPEPTLEQKIATGYNRVLQTSHEGGVQPKEYIAIYGADRVRNVSNVWMSATMGCCQCHDHKFDPYTMNDFYSMQAFFADIDDTHHLYKEIVDSSPTEREPEIEMLSDELRIALAKLEKKLARFKKQRRALAKEEGELTAARKLAKDNRAAATGDALKRINIRLNEISAQMTKLREVMQKIEPQITAIHRDARRTMITVSLKAPRVTRILARGNWLDETGNIVQPAIPVFLGKLDVGDRRATRMDLANWLIDVEQGKGGLTARVMANRFWYLLFGRGLAAMLDDFGGQGEAPSHAELLDNLGMEFIESGWDVKHILKLIAMSRTYRQSSRETPQMRENDPLNVLVAHQGRFRFPAEVVRDSTLMVSGLLVEKQGGASVKPYQPAGYYRHLNAPEREYEADMNEGQWRRGVYMHWQGQYLHPMLIAFDAPSRELCTAERPKWNTPLAALVLLNDPTFVEAARSFATRILTEAEKATEARLDFAFREVLSRSPNDKERKALAKLLEQSRSEYESNPDTAKKLLAIGLKPTPTNLDSSELATWTVVARTILSLNEVLTRN
ncbi:MAG: DUF1553 domain-containing protein [Pirellulales bacterium]